MDIPVVMIVGPPRSGTSILGRVLGCHPDISNWVEPYYVWDYHFREHPHDQRTRTDATPEIKDRIRRAFAHYRKAMGRNLVIDKSPRNSLRLPFIQEIFPEARYIFILRDGRDTVLSIKKQWEDKGRVFNRALSSAYLRKKLVVLNKWFQRKPLWTHRWQSFCFELGSPRLWLRGKFLNQVRWEGRFGWGPRFEGWQDFLDNVSLLEYCAYQWTACADQVAAAMASIAADRKFVLKYEDFIKDPESFLEALFAFLGVAFPQGFMAMIPEIWAGNTHKWPAVLTPEDLKVIRPIMEKAMADLGYEF